MLFCQRTHIRLAFLLALSTVVPAVSFAQESDDDLNTSELKVDAIEPRISLPEVSRRSGSLRVHTISQGSRPSSNDGLVRLAQQAVDTTSRRLLSSEQHTPWQMMHALLGLRHDFNILHEGQEVNGLEWMAKGQIYDGDQWFERTQYGGRAHPYSVPYAFEGHANQFLAVLSMCGLETDHEFMTAEGPITIADMIEHAKATCDTKRDEPTWTLWALSRYLPPDAVWKNANGETWSIERLVADQTSKPLKGAACGGTHGLFALAHARNVYLREGKPLRGVWLQAENKLRYYINTARRLQNPNGSLSSNYLRGRQYNPDFNKRMASAGHVLEFLMLALPQKELNQRWVRRAIEATARDLLNNRKSYVKCSPLYHSVNALNIYLDRVNPREAAPVATKERKTRTAMLDRLGIGSDTPAKGISRSRVLKKDQEKEPETTGPMPAAPEASKKTDASATKTKSPESKKLEAKPETEPRAESVPLPAEASESEKQAEADSSRAMDASEDQAKASPTLNRDDVEAVIMERLREISKSESETWVQARQDGDRKDESSSNSETESGPQLKLRKTIPLRANSVQPVPLKPVPDASKLKETADSAPDADSTEAPSPLAPLMAKQKTDSDAIVAETDEESASEEVRSAAIPDDMIASLPLPDRKPQLHRDSVNQRLLLPGRLHTGERRSNPFSIERPTRQTPLRIPSTLVSESRTLAREAATESEPQEKQQDTKNESVKPTPMAKATEFNTVPAGINDGFLDPDLDPEDWIKRFEIESREIYAARQAIVDAVDLTEGQAIADVGAGTGLFTRLFSKEVGMRGTVYAIDISPRLVTHLEEQVQLQGLSNVTVVRNDATSIQLVTQKIDKAFVCDTYHHFERPDAMLKSIHRALNDGGELVVIDFERIPGESRDWVMGHVRAGKETFRAEIEASGFEFVREVDVDGLKENYLLVFRKQK